MFILVPSLVAAHKREMHRALLVPEILLIIFEFVTDESGKPLLPTLAGIARTCRPFHRQVQEILWHRLPSVSALYNILPPQVRNKESRSWSLNRRMFSGPDWTRFMDRASRVRMLTENTSCDLAQHERCMFLAMAALRVPLLLTPNLRKLEWRANDPTFSPVINLFIGPSLRSLDISVKLLINCAIRVTLGDVCPELEHLKIAGNGRSVASTISGVLRKLHRLESLACSTLDNDAFVHLAQLKELSHLAVDMRWSMLNLDVICDRLLPGSFHSLRTLYWKDYNLNLLADIFLMPDVSLFNVHLEIESFCTSSSLRAFLHSFAVKFPHTQDLSLVHDVGASERFGLQVDVPGREHDLGARDLEPLFALKSLRALNLVDLGNLRLDDELVKTIASASPGLERLSLGTDASEHMPTTSITFDGLLSLLRHCPELQSLGFCIDAEDMLSFWDTTVRHERVMHVRLEGSILGSRRAEVDAMLRRVMPGLETVEESLDGVIRRVRRLDGKGDGRVGGRRRTRQSLESARSG